MDVPGGGGGSPAGSETGTSGPWQGGGCHFLEAPLSAAPSLPRASLLGPPLGHPAAPGGQTCPCGWTQSSADPCLDPCLEHRYRQPLARTAPPGSPGLGPHSLRASASPAPPSSGPPTLGAAPRVVPVQDLLPTHQQLSRPGQALLPPGQPQLPSHLGWAEWGMGGTPPFPVLGAPPALAVGCHGICTTCTHLPYPGRSLPALASSHCSQAGQGTWPCGPKPPQRWDRLMDWAHPPRWPGSPVLLGPAPTGLPAPCGPGPGRAPAAPHDELGVPLHVKGSHQPPRAGLSLCLPPSPPSLWLPGPPSPTPCAARGQAELQSGVTHLWGGRGVHWGLKPPYSSRCLPLPPLSPVTC